jgi:hypothetical protein
MSKKRKASASDSEEVGSKRDADNDDNSDDETDLDPVEEEEAEDEGDEGDEGDEEGGGREELEPCPGIQQVGQTWVMSGTCVHFEHDGTTLEFVFSFQAIQRVRGNTNAPTWGTAIRYLITHMHTYTHTHTHTHSIDMIWSITHSHIVFVLRGRCLGHI